MKPTSMLVLGCLITLTASGCTNQPTPPPLFLGHVAALSGSDARAGKQAEHGIQLALEHLGPEASKQLADRPLVVRHVDAASLDAMEAAGGRLASINRVAGLLGGLSHEQAMRLDRARIPVLSPAGLRTSTMSEMMFTTGVPPGQRGAMLAKHLAAEATAPALLVVDQRREEGQVLAEAFKKTWADTTNKFEYIELALDKDMRLDELAAHAAKLQPKSVVFVGEAADFLSFRRQLKTKAVWAYAGQDGGLAAMERGDSDKVLVATAFALDKDAGKVQEFIKSYRVKFQNEPTVFAAVAYDNLRLFAEALQRGQSVAAKELREELLKIESFAGVTGPLWFGSDQQLRRPAFLAELGQGGVPVAVQTMPP